MTKRIAYDRETRDFAMYLNGELVGFAATYGEAEAKLDALVYDILAEAAAAAPVEALAADALTLHAQPVWSETERISYGVLLDALHTRGLDVLPAGDSAVIIALVAGPDEDEDDGLGFPGIVRPAAFLAA